MEQNNPLPTPAIPYVPPQTEPPRWQKLKSAAGTIAIILLAPLFAFILTSFVFQSYEVDGPSMESTLQNRDRLIVLKTARTWSRITGHPYVPHRGDVVIFVKKGLYEFDGNREKQLIKRVIGLPGDHVVIKDSLITIYNPAHPNGFDPDKVYSYGSVIGATSGNIDLTVPANQIFVCGDNRGNSLDSRYFGTVPVKDVVGKLGLRIFPLSKAEKF